MSADCPILVLDACVLYPASLRSLMMWLAVEEVILPKWTDEIHEEWISNLLKKRSDLTREKLEETRRKMDEKGGDCIVTGHERHIDSLTLPDMDDRHVLAAAIESGADAIITWNIKDFPKRELKKHGLEVQTPDQLICTLLAERLENVLSAMRQHRASLINPPKSPEEYLEMLEAQGLKQSVVQLRDKVSEF